ncbi:MAG: hypothetical protein K6348_02040, partial [Deferribacterales bacterium]
FPQCSKPFIIVLSDINTSFDSDQLLGSYFNPAFTGDLPNFHSQNLADLIGQNEGINGLNWFVGQSGSNFDTICSSKNVSSLGSLRGLCPEEPTKQGGYYLPAASYYGYKRFKSETNKPANISSFFVAASAPVADLTFKVSGQNVRVIPVGKSVSGCLNIQTSCADKSIITVNADGLKLQPKPGENPYCPTNQIVDYYIEELQYDSEGNLIKAVLRINFEDVEQGADHDMDAIVRYTITTGNGTITIKVDSEYAAGCIDQAMGFSISGTTSDGIYLVVKDKDVGNSSIIKDLPLTWEKTFVVSGNSAGILKNPLWYAAKWGNFDDYDKSGYPDKIDKWDKDNDGVPDAYYEAFEGNKLESSLDAIMAKILSISGSGTGVALLTERTSSASIAMQGVFNSNKIFENDKSIDWIGTVYGWWTYAYGGTDNNTVISIREDTVNDKKLNLLEDYVLSYRYDTLDGMVKLVIDRKEDTDGDGDGDISWSSSNSFDNVTPIWDSGLILLSKAPNNRVIFTHNYSGYNSTGKVNFDEANKNNFGSLLGSEFNTDELKDKLIRYIRGVDYTGWRNRTVTYKGVTGTWKIGDIIHSKPQLVKYKDSKFDNFDVLYVGANDGMLHAFRVGKTKDIKNLETKDMVKLCNDKNLENCANDLVGEELWGFIPRNVIPYLKYLKDPRYCHMYFVDLPPYIIDEGEKKILIGGLRLGGGCECGNNESYCIKSETNGLSSYFALDISDPTNPIPLWEFSHDDLGFSFTGPAYVKRNDGKFIIFGNGPSDYKGHTSKNLKFFVLQLNTDFKINSTTILDPNIQRAFSGKLFTEGIDVNNDGQTDFVLAGYNQTQPSGNNSQGGDVVIHTKNGVPNTWDINKTYLNFAQNAIISKIVSGSCFGKPYIFLGSGRHFYVGDNEGTPGNNDENYIWGLPFTCDANEGCKGTINSAHSVTLQDDPCLALQDNVTGSGNQAVREIGWKYPLAGTSEGYLREKVLIDPVVFKDQIAILVSNRYKTDPCTMESESKIWMLNCATGRSINTTKVCSGYEVTAKPTGIAVDTAGGLSPLDPSIVDANTGYYTSPVGIVDITVDENLGVGSPRKGRILFWIEK